MATLIDNAAKDGLSKRMATTIEAFLPIVNALASRGEVGSEDIDLSHGENRLLRLEMVEICKKTVAHSTTADVFANPVGFVGDKVMKTALAQHFTRYFNPSISITADCIVPTAGSGNALDALIFTLCDAGDAVLCPAPVWWGYHPYARFHAEANIIPAFVEPLTSSSWATDSLSSAIIQALEAAYSAAPNPKRIKALLTSNPNNPMMNCWPKEVVRKMMDFCHERNLHYISDEVFANTVFDPEAEQFVSALSLLRGLTSDADGNGMKSLIDSSRVHILWSTSKDFGASGIRAGCIASYHPLVRTGVSFATAWQVSSLAARFTEKLLTADLLPEFIVSVRSQLCQGYQTCRDILSDPRLFGRVQLLPASAGLWANLVITLKEDETLQGIIVKARQNGVVVGGATEFSPFLRHGQGILKITFAMPKDILARGLERLKTSLL